MSDPKTARPKSSVAMSPAEILSFLRQGKPAAVCVPDGQGGMVARMARYELQDEDVNCAMTVTLSGAAADVARGSLAGACVLVDTYPTYGDIRGVMLHGKLLPAAAGVAQMLASRASGFDFAKIPRGK